MNINPGRQQVGYFTQKEPNASDCLMQDKIWHPGSLTPSGQVFDASPEMIQFVSDHLRQ